MNALSDFVNESGLQMAVACCSWLWNRDEQLAREMRAQVMADYELNEEVWDLAVAQLADYTRRHSDHPSIDVEQFLRIGFKTGAGEGEELDSNPTAEACGATSRLNGPCVRGVGHPGNHHDVAGKEWVQGGDD